MDENMLHQGVLYICFGEQYREEAAASIISLRSSNPGLPVAMVTDREWDRDCQVDIVVLKEPINSLGCVPAYINLTPFRRTLYIDPDTFFAEDIKVLFHFLDFYNVGIFQDGPMLRDPGGLYFVPQCNGGVILFDDSIEVRTMFQDWKNEYFEREKQLLRQLQQIGAKGLRNQKILSRILAKSKQVRVGQLPSCVNLTTWRTVKIYNRPRIWHSRLTNVRSLHRQITSRWESDDDVTERIWMPHIRGFLPELGVLTRDWILALALRFRLLRQRVVLKIQRYWSSFR